MRRNVAFLVAAALGAASVTMAIAAPAAAGKSAKTGTLTVEAQGVTVLPKGAAKFTKAKNNQKVKTGDTIQTDATGLAQITFPDGSLTRLDHETVFTLEKLSTKAGDRQVEGTVSAGQTWNRVQKLSETDTFEQKGSGATAAVLGTSFVTKCSLPTGTKFKVVKTKKALKKLSKRSTCKFTLVDGKLQLTAVGKSVGVNRGQTVDVAAGGAAGDAQTLPPDILFADQWITKNLTADTQAGLSEASGPPTEEDVRYSRIDGSWSTTLTVVGNDGFRDLNGARTRTYVFSGSCTGGTCTVTLTRQTANGTDVIPLGYANGVYAGNDPDMGTQDCLLDDGRVSVPGGLRNSGTVEFRPTAAVADNGLWRATRLAGTVTETATQIAGAPNQCRTGTATFDLVAGR